MSSANFARPFSNLKDKEYLYRLIISQMVYDGYDSVAINLAEFIQPKPECAPSNRLLHLMQLGLQADPEAQELRNSVQNTNKYVLPGVGIDLEFDCDVQSSAPDASRYETCYVTSHKAPCRTAAFSRDGQLVATGSEDSSIKILDTERMLIKSQMSQTDHETEQQKMESHPVIRTLYDHSEEVLCLDFHPTQQVLVSGGKDYTVKVYDFSKPSVKKAMRTIQEASVVRCLSIHPSGDYVIVGCMQPTLRLYDLTTLRCFVSSHSNDQHTEAVNCVKYSPYAQMYATCSNDGCIKLWDTVSNRCVATWKDAHDGEPVCSVQFSRNCKFVLSSGKDSLVKLWEVSTGRPLVIYTGAGSCKQKFQTRAVFNHTEDYVFFPDESTTSLCCWDSRNAERQQLLSLGHNNVVRCISHSPTQAAFMTCSDDFRARFWYKRTASD